MSSKDPSTQPERKKINPSRLIVILFCLAAVAAAGIAIRKGVLTKKATVQQARVSNAVQPAPNNDIASAQLERTSADKPSIVVDMRGKGKIKPEEVTVEEATVGGIEQTRMSRGDESESERERERKKGRYAYIGRVARMAGQSVSNTPPIKDDRPTERRLNRAGRSFDGDLRNLPRTKPVQKERPEREDPAFNPRELRREAQPPSQPVEKLLKPLNTALAPAALTGFEGLDRENWGAGSPPDTNGDVGPTYYIQTVNSSVGIYDKTTGTQVAAFTLDTLMSQGNFGNQCDTENFGDPVVLYDTFEDRWIITDFAFTLDGGGNVNPPIAFQCFAVSKTGNPVSGGWNFYSIAVTDALNDYPKFGVWTDGIYMSSNLFGFASGGSFQGVRTWAFNKARMYAGAPTAQVVSFNVGAGDFTVIPSNARLQVGTPPPGRPNLFLSTSNFLNAVSVYKFHVDWNSIGLSTFTGPDVPLASTSWPNANVANAPQPGTATLLDVLATRAMVQNQYTNYSGVESLWASHTVRRANTTGFAAPRWYQVNVTGGTVAANLPQATTWDPNGANVVHRFMPSVGLDRAGNMAMGYSTSSSTVFPSFAYAGRLAGDPINTFSQTEQTLFTGTASQTGTTRWGDYSAMTLDPNGCTFWYTTEYANPVSQAFDKRWKTRVNSFSYAGIGQCTPVGAGGTVSGTVIATVGGAPISGATVALGSRTTTTNGSGFYQFLNIPAGTYPSITASAPGYISSTVINLVVNDGATTTQNFSLGTAPAGACLTDTTQADFQMGVGTNVDLTTSPGDVTLLNAPNLDQSNTAGTTTGTSFSATSWGGQTFIPAVTGTLAKVDVQLFCSACTGTTPNLTVSIRATSGGLPTGADLVTATIPGFSSGSAAYYTATFGSPPSLTSGTQYALIVRPVANPSVGGYFWIRSSPSTYANGQRVTTADSGGTWAADVTRDFNFRTYMLTGYAASGNLISSTKDANPAVGATPHWTTLSWTATVPANTNLKFQAAASNSVYGPFNFVGPDGTAATFFTTSGASLSQFDGLRYLQYKAYLSTTNSAATPTLNDVTVCYSNITGVVAGGGTICAGASANVTVTVTGGTAPYTVILTNGGGTQTGNGPVFTFPVSPGSNTTYTLAAGSKDANNIPIIGSGSAAVMVNPIPAIPPITPAPAQVCATSAGNTASGPAGASSYTWTIGNGTITSATNIQTITYTAGASGTAMLNLTVTNVLGCGASNSVNVPITPLPAISNAGPDQSVCGLVATLAGNAAGIGTGTWTKVSGPGIVTFSNVNAPGSIATASLAGTYTLRWTISNGNCSSTDDVVVSLTDTITVNPATLPNGIIGTGYSQTVSATPAGPYNFAVTSGALPNGLALNALTGAITGTPVSAATFNFRITATSGTCSGFRDYTVTISCSAITLTPATLPAGTAGVAYSQTIAPSPAGSYTFSLIAGVLPSGMTINPTTGVISGLAVVVGTYTFTIKADAGNGCSGTQNYSLQINCPAAITISPASLPNGTAGTAYSQIFSATPAGGNYSFALSGTLPPGLSLNSGTGVLSGTPTTNGAFNFSVTATGFGSCASAPKSYSITIGSGGCSVTLPSSLPGGTVGQLYSQSVAASPAGSYTYTQTGTLPPGVSFINAASLLFGFPTTQGSFTFSITATDSSNCTVTQSYTVVIGTTLFARTGDFDGDGKTDFTVWRGMQSNWSIIQSSDGQSQNVLWGAEYAPYNDVITPGDYDGDGKTDIAVFRRGNGHWYIKRSSDGATVDKSWGLGTDVPVPADYDGDGKTDIAVWRGSEGRWYIVRSSDGTVQTDLWGGGYAPYNDVPVPADYDGDGKTDIAVFRRGNGHWYIKRSSDGVVVDKYWGLGTDVPVPADYDGDGKADIAVWRGSDTNWYIVRSSNDTVQTVSWGSLSYGDKPTPGDYDGDGKADIAIWRESSGTWYVRCSGDGSVMTKINGQAGDRPISSRPN